MSSKELTANGTPLSPPLWWTVIKQIAPGVRMRQWVYAPLPPGPLNDVRNRWRGRCSTRPSVSNHEHAHQSGMRTTFSTLSELRSDSSELQIGANDDAENE